MIVKLPIEVSNQIAAGEVVERPASVVKELLENAIDAGAKNISVDIENAGKDLIRVKDDGCGIEQSDLPLLFERNATSKVRSIEDVYSVSSLGFRGEALASIAAVSKVVLVSKTEGSSLGKKVLYYNGEVHSEEEVASNRGSTFSISDIFYNTPVRYKFLKSDATEKAKIASIVSKIALSKPDISFSLSFDSKTAFTTSGRGRLDEALGVLYGRDLLKSLVFAESNANEISIKAYLARPEYSRGNRSQQFVIVNDRVVDSKLISRAVEEAYEGLMMKGKFPAYAISLSLPPKTVDVNIHPQKLEIKFVREDIVESLVFNTIRNALLSKCGARQIGFDYSGESVKKNENPARKLYESIMKESYVRPKEQTLPINEQGTSFAERPETHNSANNKIKSQSYEYSERKTIADFGTGVERDYYIPDEPIVAALQSEFIIPEQEHVESESLESYKPNYDEFEIIGQLFSAFVICQHGETAYFIDQHAAHERILFERYYRDFIEGKVHSQLLLEPIVYEGTISESDNVEGAMKLFESLGIAIERQSDSTWLIKSAPIFGEPISEDDIRWIIETYAIEKHNSFHKNFVDRIIMRSCKSAIKAGDSLNKIQIRDLLKMLNQCDNPHSCPHGRPTTIEMTRRDFDKLFKRIV